jgi:hypothetical protein
MLTHAGSVSDAALALRVFEFMAARGLPVSAQVRGAASGLGRRRDTGRAGRQTRAPALPPLTLDAQSLRPRAKTARGARPTPRSSASASAAGSGSASRASTGPRGAPPRAPPPRAPPPRGPPPRAPPPRAPPPRPRPRSRPRPTPRPPAAAARAARRRARSRRPRPRPAALQPAAPTPTATAAAPAAPAATACRASSRSRSMESTAPASCPRRSCRRRSQVGPGGGEGGASDERAFSAAAGALRPHRLASCHPRLKAGRARALWGSEIPPVPPRLVCLCLRTALSPLLPRAAEPRAPRPPRPAPPPPPPPSPRPAACRAAAGGVERGGAAGSRAAAVGRDARGWPRKGGGRVAGRGVRCRHGSRCAPAGSFSPAAADCARPLPSLQAKGLQPLDTTYLHMARLAAIDVRGLQGGGAEEAGKRAAGLTQAGALMGSVHSARTCL